MQIQIYWFQPVSRTQEQSYIEFSWHSYVISVSDGEKSKEISQRFLHKIQQTDALRHFKKIYKKSADRVLKRQISMIHIESGIECLILFQKTPYIVESTEVLKRFATNSLCKQLFWIEFVIEILTDQTDQIKKCTFNFSGNDLIAFVRMWQNILSQRGTFILLQLLFSMLQFIIFISFSVIFTQVLLVLSLIRT